jgi:hypothetical protein
MFGSNQTSFLHTTCHQLFQQHPPLFFSYVHYVPIEMMIFILLHY